MACYGEAANLVVPQNKLPIKSKASGTWWLLPWKNIKMSLKSRAVGQGVLLMTLNSLKERKTSSKDKFSAQGLVSKPENFHILQLQG